MTMVPDPPIGGNTGNTTIPGTLNINLPPAPPPNSNGPPVKTYTEEEVLALLGKVRGEEKDKLYPQLTDLEAKVKTFEDERNIRLQAEEEARNQAAAEAEAKLRDESSAKDLVTQTEERLLGQLAEVRGAWERSEALRQKDAEVFTLMQYRERRLREEADNIHQSYTDFVRGNSEQEIEAAIQDMIARTNQVAEEIRARDAERGYLTPPRLPVIPVSGSGPTIDSSIGEPQTTTLSAAEIAAMSPEEYMRFRPQLMQAASDHVRTRGLYAQ